mgnify:FL=1|jgi:hypothetical protein
MKLLSECYHENFIFRLYSSKNTEFACNLSNYNNLPLCFAWFASIMMSKLLTNNVYFSELGAIPERSQLHSEFFKDDYIHGFIYKKSQVLGKWDRRFVIINKRGLYSFKDQNEIKPTFSINAEDMKYMWTRFDIEMGDLVIKVKYGSSKTEFAIPIINFMERKNNWLFAFYRLIIERFSPWIQAESRQSPEKLRL